MLTLTTQSRISTQIGLRPVEDVPFPAVLIDLGRPGDPMGYLKYTGDIVGPNEIPKEGSFGNDVQTDSLLYQSKW